MGTIVDIPDELVASLDQVREEGCMLVTGNTRDFEVEWPDVGEPYRCDRNGSETGPFFRNSNALDAHDFLPLCA